jgi:molybdenum cofactor cytidylyltransferase
VTPGAARFAAVILAAGASSRMGTIKALLDAGAGESFLDHLAGVFLDAGCAVYAVLGEDAGPIARASRRGSEITFVLNPDPSRGQLSSLQCGLRAAMTGADAIFFTPVDAPGISPQTVLVLQNFLAGMDFAIPIYEGKRGHPVLLRTSCAAEFLNPSEGASARDILHARRASTRFVEVLDPGILEDIDDPATYENWRSSPATDGGDAQ